MILLIIIISLLIIDLYTLKGIKTLLSKSAHRGIKQLIYSIFWVVTVVMLLLICLGYMLRSSTHDNRIFQTYFYFFGVFLVIYVPKLIFIVFHLLDDLFAGVKWIVLKIQNHSKSSSGSKPGKPISRSTFITQAGLIIAAVPFVALIGGIVKGRFNFKVEQVKLSFRDLPHSFVGLKIVQISDLHIGSFTGSEHKVRDAIQLLNDQEADYVFFTGDLVNNFYDELKDDWIPILSRIRAKTGKYSILGNHDYGNYYHWENASDKEENFQKIIKAHEEIGFHLLKNESVKLTSGDDVIGLVGVENWGHPPFPQLADYEKACRDVIDVPFKILLSHDPTHWDAKILDKTDVQLTLSGHTHGMQFGIKLGNHRWSPASFKYPRWAGLYKEGKQFLYVNRGFGYIGYPGRVGMPPEITVIEFVG